MTPEPLVQRLIDLQSTEGLTGAAMAAKLGIDAGHWSKVRRGLVTAGRDTVDGALRAYPELRHVLAESLQERNATAALMPS